MTFLIMRKSKEYWKEYRAENRERKREYDRKRFQEKKKELREYYKKRLATDEVFASKEFYRRGIRGCLKEAMQGRFWRFGKIVKALGCSGEEFLSHIVNQFQEGMTLDNYGEWEIDHDSPLGKAKTIEEVIKLNHYSNLKPLWEKDNKNKGDSC